MEFTEAIMREDKIKRLPKQWGHWCRLTGLRKEGRKGGRKYRAGWAWFSLQGRGRRFRVSCDGTLDVSCREDDFDRWANSYVTGVPCPKTEAEFRKAIGDLLVAARAHDAEYDAMTTKAKPDRYFGISLPRGEE